MMKKLVALLMALALLCTSIGAFAEEEIAEELVAAPVVETEEEEVTEEVPEAAEDGTVIGKDHNHVSTAAGKQLFVSKDCTQPSLYEKVCDTCGATFTDKVYDLGTKNGKHGVTAADKAAGKDSSYYKVEPSCTRKGIIVHSYCSYCSVKTWEEEEPMTDHTFDPAKHEVTEATCTKKGLVYDYCTTCKQAITEEIPMKAHTPMKAEVNVPPTCAEPGKEGSATICSVCGKIYDDAQDDLKGIDALNHVTYFKEELLDDYFLMGKENNKTTAKLIYAGEKEVKDGIVTIKIPEEPAKDANNKDYVKYGKSTLTYKEATCTEDGYIVFKCELCEKEYKVELPALGHNIDKVHYLDAKGEHEIEEKDLDCVKGYTRLFSCTRCDYKYNMVVQNATHNYEVTGYKMQKNGNSQPVVYAAPVECLEYWEVKECKDCSAKTEAYVPVKADAKHTPGTILRDTESTCTTYGEKAYTCTACLFPVYETKKTLADHSWTKEKVTKNASCTETGLREKTCSVCGKVETEVIPAIGHNFKENVVLEKADCASGKKGLKGIKCSFCGYVKDSWEYEGHTMLGDYKTYKAPKCEVAGEGTFFCTTCCKLVKEIIPATGHSYEHEGGALTGKLISEAKIKANHEAAHKTQNFADCVAPSCVTANAHGTIHTITCAWCDQKNPSKLTWEQGNKPDHTFDINGFVVDVAPTCDKDGSGSYVCKECHEIVKGYKLPALGHNKQPEYDVKQNSYKLICKPIEATAANKTALVNKMVAAGYRNDVANFIVNNMPVDKKGNLGGIGCNWTEEVEVVAPKYNISVSGGDATIKLEDEQTMTAIATPFLRVNWRYKLKNGDTVAFTYTFAPNADGKSFFIDAPECDGELQMTFIQVVGTRTAHRMDIGDYAEYGRIKF